VTEPTHVSAALLGLWVFSWVLAAVWSRRTEARPAAGQQAGSVILTAAGVALLLVGGRSRPGQWAESAPALWALPDALSWVMTGLVLAGFVFCWWARLTLGDLWSGSITRKENHTIVERGPYALVRHPIYTGLIFSAFAYGIQLGRPINVFGAALVALGFAIKARMEERFLASELGESAYADYRRRTPMLVPFWPMRA
jgi:protein-S-isoprenylcysteine O-methyltransferase Ste14